MTNEAVEQIFGDSIPNNAMALKTSGIIVTKVARMAVVISLITAATKAIEDAGYDPNDFEVDEYSLRSFLYEEPEDGEPSDEHPERMWNGPRFVEHKGNYEICAASTVVYQSGMPDSFSIDVLRMSDQAERWQIWHEGKWMPGPQEDIFEVFESIREGWDEDDDDWLDDDDDDWLDDDDDDEDLWDEDELDDEDTIFSLNITERLVCTLADAGIIALDRLTDMTEAELLRVPGIGKASVARIQKALAEVDLSLKQ